MVLLVLLATLEDQPDDKSQLLLKVYYVITLDIFENGVHDIEVDELAVLPTRDEILDDVGDLLGCQRMILLCIVADLLCDIAVEVVE